MVGNKLEKWQEVLLNWCVWADSVNNKRDVILEEHKNLDKLALKGKPKYTSKKVSYSHKYTQKTNQDYDLLLDLYEEVRDTGSKFIITALNLDSNSIYHQVLLDFWMVGVAPELYPDFDSRTLFKKVSAEIKITYVSPYSKQDSQQGRSVIIDSISWIRGYISPQNAAEQLLEIKWPSVKEVIQHSKGGRKPKDIDQDITSIICHVLYYKYRMSQPKIAKAFDWETHKGAYDKWVSSTFKARLTRGRKQMKTHGTKEMTN